MMIQRLDPNKAVFMMIDIQKRLLPVMADADDVVRNNQILLQGTKLLGVPHFVSEQYPRGLGETIDELKELFDPKDLYQKMSFSLVDDLKKEILELMETGKTQFILSGIEAHVCVFQTARDLLALGMQVVVASDAVSSRKTAHAKAALDHLQSIGASILPTETILFDLQRRSGVEPFKEISALVK